MLDGMVITNGLSGLKDEFCSNIKLKRNVNKEGAQSKFGMSICAGVVKITKDKTKISLKYFLLIVATTEQINSELNI